MKHSSSNIFAPGLLLNDKGRAHPGAAASLGVKQLYRALLAWWVRKPWISVAVMVVAFSLAGPASLTVLEGRRSAWISLIGLMLVSLVAMVRVRSLRVGLLTLCSLLFVPAGSLIALWLGVGGPLTEGSFIGMGAVSAIASLNAIRLIFRYRSLEQQGHGRGTSLVLTGAEERLLPELMTAALPGLVLLACTVTGRISGGADIHSLAWALLGGLASSAFAQLFLLPGLYARYAHTPYWKMLVGTGKR